MYPMLNSEKDWLLTVTLNDVVADYVKPERKSVASLFNIGGSEVVSFYGTKQMSPFNFDCFNSVTQRWHQLLAGFQFDAAGTHSSFELA